MLVQRPLGAELSHCVTASDVPDTALYMRDAADGDPLFLSVIFQGQVTMVRFLALGMSPLLLVGIIFLVCGYRAGPGALTDDGYSLKSFCYIMGAVFVSLPLLSVVLTGTLKARQRLMLAGAGDTRETGVSLKNSKLRFLVTEVRTDGGEAKYTNPKVFDTHVHATQHIRTAGKSGAKYLIQEIEVVE